MPLRSCCRSHTGSVSARSGGRVPRSSRVHSHAASATTTPAKTRNEPVTTKSMTWLAWRERLAFTAARAPCPAAPSGAFAAASTNAACFTSRSRAIARNPMRGCGWNIFCHPAVNVTDNSQHNGSNVTRAMAGDRLRTIAIFNSNVVPSTSATDASNWFAIPNNGHNELMPPSGSRTPCTRNQPQAPTTSPDARTLGPVARVSPRRGDTCPRKSCNRYRPTRVPASSVVRMNNASNITAKWYHNPSPRPAVTSRNTCAIPTASVAAPPVRPYNDFS